MKAAVLVEREKLVIEERPMPKPGPDEVLVAVKHVGVCGSDINLFTQMRTGKSLVKEPLVLGHEFSGVVAELGKNVNGPRLGQKVAVEPTVNCGQCEYCVTGRYNICPNLRFAGLPGYDGGNAEYTLCRAQNLFPVPDDLSTEEAALVEPLAIAFHAVELAPHLLGTKVAIVGAGPIGLMILALARLSGADEICVTEPVEARREMALRYGADVVIDPKARDSAETVQAETGGRGADVTFEAAGEHDTIQNSIDITRPGGHVVAVGIYAKEVVTIETSEARRKELTLQWCRRSLHNNQQAIEFLYKARVDFRPLITHRFPLQRIQEAYEMVREKRDGVVKAMIEM